MTATDTDDLRKRLEESLGPVQLSDLNAHLDRQAVFLVAPELSLLDCAIAIAKDERETVAGWLEREQLRRPTADERTAWGASPDRRWLSVVVKPFVLVQDLG